MIDFRAVILREMELQGMKKTVLAKRAGVAYSTLNSYLTGGVDTCGENIARLLDALGVNMVGRSN